jgi:hypothetical protein
LHFIIAHAIFVKALPTIVLVLQTPTQWQAALLASHSVAKWTPHTPRAKLTQGMLAANPAAAALFRAAVLNDFAFL